AWAGSQLWILRGERSGLSTRIAGTESVSLCVRMRSGLRFWNSNVRFAPAANCLDKLARFSADSASLNGFESGGGLSPARFFACSRPAVRKINHSGKGERKNHEPIDSAKKSSSSISRRGGLLPAFCRHCKRSNPDAYSDSYANTDSYSHRFCYWRSRCGGG